MFLARFFSSEGMDLFPDQYLFKWQHFLYLGICLFLFFFLMKVPDHRNPKVRKAIVWTSCILLLLFKYGGEAIFVTEWYLYGDAVSSFSHPFWDWRTLVSFQVCGVNNVLLPLAVAFDWKRVKHFVFPSSIIGGIAALLYPVGVLFGDPISITFPLLRTLIVHFLLIFLPCYLIKTGEYRMDGKHWLAALVGSLLMSAWSMFGNLVVDPGANYMYLMRNPFQGGPVPVLNAIPDGWHMFVLAALVFLGFLLVFAGGRMYERKFRKPPENV